MSMNYNEPGRTTRSVTEDESPMFAPVPAWERGKKRKGLGGMMAPKRVAETRTFETTDATTYRDERPAMAAATGAGLTAATMDTRRDAYDTTTTTTTTTANDGAFAAPIGRTSRTATRKSKGGVPGAAVALGVLALAGVAGAGFYMAQDDEPAVAELTPMTTDTSGPALATAPMAPPVETRPTQVASAEPVRASATTTRRVTTARVRPASAPSAAEAGINASGTATLPSGPQPYSTLQGATAGTPAPVTPAPTVTPPVTEQPAAIPATPPIAAEPAPANPAPTAAAPAPTPDPTEQPLPDPM